MNHPLTFIEEGSAATLRDTAFEAERMKDLHPGQLSLIYRHGWFKMFIPKQWGGLGLSLPEALKLEEGLSYADGSAGWVVTLCGGAGWFAGFLGPKLRDAVVGADELCIAGSGAVSGIAEVTGQGYSISGFWKYASGSLHATAFTANCVIHENGIPKRNEDGSQIVRAFLFFRDEVIVHRRWNGMGMIATGSHSFEVRGLAVPASRCFTIDPESANIKDPVYRYPFLQFAETTLSINVSGMSGRFLDLCAPLLARRTSHRHSGSLDDQLILGKQELENYRTEFYAAVHNSWNIIERGQDLATDVLAKLSAASLNLSTRSRQIVDELYPHCGIAAADTSEEINRVWRNIHTASQHTLLLP